MDKPTEALAGAGCTVLLSPFLVLLMAPLALWEAVAIVPLWTWFVTPVTGLPPLGYVQAAGLALVVRLLRPSQIPNPSPRDRTMAENGALIAVLVMSPLTSLGFGYLLKLLLGA